MSQRPYLLLSCPVYYICHEVSLNFAKCLLKVYLSFKFQVRLISMKTECSILSIINTCILLQTTYYYILNELSCPLFVVSWLRNLMLGFICSRLSKEHSLWVKRENSPLSMAVQAIYVTYTLSTLCQFNFIIHPYTRNEYRHKLMYEKNDFVELFERLKLQNRKWFIFCNSLIICNDLKQITLYIQMYIFVCVLMSRVKQI